MYKKLLFLVFIGYFSIQNIFAQSNNTFTKNDTANYPYWIEMMQNPNANFYSTQSAFYKYWQGRSRQKSDGYKVFKRWESFWKTRVNVDGYLPQAGSVISAYKQFLANSNTTKSSNGGWYQLGPVSMPVNGTGQPNGLGRINCIAFHPTIANNFYIGAPSGGLWKTTTGGASWTSLTDTLPTLGISAILVHPTTPNTLYIGTGDRDAGDAAGLGVWRSLDGGSSWANISGIIGNATVNMMLMHPTNSQIIIAATSTGIYKTINGGTSWTKTSGTANFKDIKFKPGTPTTMYATAAGVFYISSNTGDSWTTVTSVLPGTGRLVIGVTAANPAVVYAVVGSSTGLTGVYKSTNSGTSFTVTTTTPNILGYSEVGTDNRSQAWYDLCVAVSPTDANVLYVGGVNIWKSTNGGTTFTINAHWVGSGGVPAVHADIHCLDYSPLSTNTLYTGCDGGLYKTTNGGTAWTEISSGLAIGQIYRIGQGARNPNLVMCGFQDNGTAKCSASGWRTVIGGDGMECLVDPTNNLYLYGSVYYGEIARATDGQSFTDIAGNGINGITEEGGWIAPFTLHATNPNTMFLGLKNVWRSTNVKAPSASSITWTAISTFGNTADLDVIENSSANTDLLFVSRANTLFRSTNVNAATPTWTTLSPGVTITDLETDPINQQIVYMTGGNAVYKSINQGANWTNIKANLPNISINCIVLDTSKTNESIYVGTDAGVYYKNSSMSNWILFSTGLPPAAEITELEIFYGLTATASRITAATYGRGLWQSDLYSITNAPPVPDFTANSTSPCSGASVSFSDLSSNAPTSWVWTITPNTVAFVGGTNMNTQNPIIKFNSAGTYTIKLKVTNSFGADSITKTSYISVGSPNSTPLNEGFGTFISGTPGTLMNGWTLSNSGAFSWYVNNGPTPTTTSGPASDHTSGTNSGKYLYTEASTPAVGGEETQLISPCLAIPSSGSPNLSFYYHMYGDGIVALNVDVFFNGVWVNNVFSLTGQQQLSETSPWLQANVPLNAYVGNTINIRFRVICGSGATFFNGDIAIDDIFIGTPGQPLANFLATTTSTYQGFPVSFVDMTSNNPTSWQWTFSPSSVTYINSTNASSQNPIVKFNTAGVYTVKLKATNAVGSDSITKTSYITVSSALSVPYSNNFESFVVGTPGTMNGGWSINTSGNFKWYVNAGGTASALTGPTVDHTFGNSTGKYLYTEASSPAVGGETAILYTPAFDLTSVSNASLKFWYHMYGDSISALVTEVFYNGNWVLVNSIIGQQQTTETASWMQASVNLTAYVGNIIQLRFKVLHNNDYRNDVSLDDFQMVVLSPPVNDNPCGAISLNVGTSCSNIIATNTLATNTTSVSSPACGVYAGADVWFKCIVPASGYLQIEGSQIIGGLVNGAMAAYKGNCSSMTYLACNDDYSTVGGMPRIYLSGLTGGDTVFIRFWAYNASSSGDFYICAYEPSYFAITPVTSTVTNALGSINLNILSNTSWTVSSNSTWLILNPTSGSGNSTINASYSANSGATRTATITAQPLGLSSTTVTINQTSSAVANFTFPNEIVCKSSNIIFTNTSTNASGNYWFIDNSLIGVSTNLNYTFNSPGVKEIKLVSYNTTSSDTIKKLLFVTIPPFVNAGNDTTVCQSSNVNFNGATASGLVKCISNCVMPNGYCPSVSVNNTMEYIIGVSLNGATKTSGRIADGYQDHSSNLLTYLVKDSTYSLQVTGYTTALYNEYVEAFIDWNRNGQFDEPSISLGSANFNGSYLFSGVITVPSNIVLGKTKMRIILKYNAAVTSGCENAYSFGETEDFQIELMKYDLPNVLWTGPSSFNSSLLNPTISNISTSQNGTYTLLVKDSIGCTSTDSRLVTVIAKPTVTFGALPNLCTNSNAITLNQGSPSGGVYSGPGVTGTTFNPLVAGVGSHTITYTYTNSNGCSNSVTKGINVYASPLVSLANQPSICSNTAAFALTGGSPAAGVYSGPGVSGGIFNPSTAGVGNHTIKYVYTNANSCSDSATKILEVKLAPTATLGSFANVCSNGSSFTLSGGSPSGGVYSGNGVVGTQFNPSVAGAGTHTITYTNTAANGCQASASSNITVLASPMVTLNSFANVCTNSPIMLLSGGLPTGGVYSGTGVSANNFMPALAGAGTHTITYTVTSNGCTSSTQKTIVVNSATTVSFSGLPTSACVNDANITLTPSPAGGTFSGTGMLPGNVFSPANAGFGLHQITYTFTNANSCVSTNLHSIQVNNIPTVNAGLDQTIVTNTAAQLSGAVVGGSGNYSYLWTPTNKVINAANAITMTVALTGSQQFTLKGTDNTTGCSSTDQMLVITTGPVLNVNISSLNNSICQGESTTLQAIASGGTGTYTYNWSSIPTGFTSNQASITVSPTSTMTYVVIINDGVNNTNSSQQITVKPKPTVTFPSLADVCLVNQQIGLNGATPSGGNYFGSGVSAGGFNPSLVGAGIHTIYYAYTATNGCSDTANRTIKVNPKPIVTLSSFASTCVSTGNITLTGGNPSGGTYSGTTVSNGIFNTQSAGVGSHLIKYKFVDANSCSDSVIQSLMVYANPVANAGIDKNVNYNNSTTLNGTASAGSGNYTYSWSPSAYLLSSNVANVTTIPLTQSTLFTLNIVDVTSGCSGSDQIAVNLLGGPLSASAQADNSSVCYGSSTTLHALGGGGNGSYSYTWTSNPVGFSSTLQNPTVSPIVTTTYTLKINDIIDSSNANVIITVNPLPIVNLGNDTIVCQSSGLLLNAGSGYLNYSWSTGTNQQFQLVDVNSLPIGTYIYGVTVTNSNGCKGSDNIAITVGTAKSIKLGNDTIICNTSQLPLNAGTGFSSYLWSNGSSNQYLVVDSLMGLGPHLIFVQALDAGGCAAYDTIVVIINNCYGLEENHSIFKVEISPNPSKGDFFIIIENSVSSEKLQIEVWTIDGRKLQQEEIYDSQKVVNHRMNLKKYSDGVYLLKIKQGNYIQTKRVILTN